MLEEITWESGVASLWAWVQHPVFNLGGTKLSILTASLLAFGAVVAWSFTARIERALVGNFFPRFSLESGRAFTLARVVRYLAMLAGGVVAFHLAGVDLSGLAVVGGFLSIGVGFGLQNVTSNFIAGLIVLFERPIKPGDMIRVADRVGTVQDVRLRSTTIRTFDGLFIIVPNSEFISQEVVNYSFGDPHLRLHLPVGLAYDTPPEEAKALLLEVALAHPEVLAEPPPQVWLKGFGPSALEFELLAWIGDANRDRVVISELYFALLAALKARGFGIPYPQMTVHLDGTQPRFSEASPKPSVEAGPQA